LNPNQFQRRRVWSLTIRIWHWLLALAVCTAWGFGEFMDFATIQWHFYLGYSILALLVFRLLLGLWGPQAQRFSALPLGPGRIRTYLGSALSRTPGGEVGHNPLGSLSLIAMLLALLAQAGTGLFIESEDFFEYGPLADYVSESTIHFMGIWHHRIAKLLLFLVGMHLAAMVYYRLWKRENLLLPMITGWKWVKAGRNNEQQKK